MRSLSTKMSRSTSAAHDRPTDPLELRSKVGAVRGSEFDGSPPACALGREVSQRGRCSRPRAKPMRPIGPGPREWIVNRPTPASRDTPPPSDSSATPNATCVCLQLAVPRTCACHARARRPSTPNASRAGGRYQPREASAPSPRVPWLSRMHGRSEVAEHESLRTHRAKIDIRGPGRRDKGNPRMDLGERWPHRQVALWLYHWCQSL